MLYTRRDLSFLPTPSLNSSPPPRPKLVRSPGYISLPILLLQEEPPFFLSFSLSLSRAGLISYSSDCEGGRMPRREKPRGGRKRVEKERSGGGTMYGVAGHA